ncbi:MAG: hypothetical protein VW862_02940 [Euryarchaeota archaeon]
MAFDLTKALQRLDVNIDHSSKPLVKDGMISWLGRMYDVHPDHVQFGFTEGMEIWITGAGMAHLDLAGFESWLMDAPRGDHLLISERTVNFEISQMFNRIDRNVILWTREMLASFIGEAVLSSKISIVEENEDTTEDSEDHIFVGQGPFAIKPLNDFSILEENGLRISDATPIIIPAVIHHVKGNLVGPDTEPVEKWVLNCNGLRVIESIELMQRAPLLNKEYLSIDESPTFSKLLSVRKSHGDDVGQLLQWWKFDDNTAVIENYEVLIPGHSAVQANGKKWILEGVTNSLYRNI